MKAIVPRVGALAHRSKAHAPALHEVTCRLTCPYRWPFRAVLPALAWASGYTSSYANWMFRSNGKSVVAPFIRLSCALVQGLFVPRRATRSIFS